MSSTQLKSSLITDQYDQDFLDDMHLIFLGMGRGEASKYMYDNSDTDYENNLWEKIVTTHSNYYVPEADNYLMNLARTELDKFIPLKTPYIDFGVGGRASFKKYVLPTMTTLSSSTYIGVDFDKKILDQVKLLQGDLNNITVNTTRMDFFKPSNRIISKVPALGVMNGVTLGNMYGSVHDINIGPNLIAQMKYLSQLTYFGWLLVSIDTNQDEASLMNMYLTPLNSVLNIASIPRMAKQLPVTDFDPSLFEYQPIWLADRQLVAHMAIATKNQQFSLDQYPIKVRRGDKLHLFNSYKFKREFFEDSCTKANLEIQMSWAHNSGVLLYLLKHIS